MKMKTHKAVYGKVSMVRACCPVCGEFSFVIDGEMACCGAKPPDLDPKYIIRMTKGRKRKKRPTPARQKVLLESQNYKCFYCGCDLRNSWYVGGRMKLPKRVTIHYDHLVPWVYSIDDGVQNIVAACSVCNMIKTSRVFPTVEKLREWVLSRREKRNYEIL